MGGSLVPCCNAVDLVSCKIGRSKDFRPKLLFLGRTGGRWMLRCGNGAAVRNKPKPNGCRRNIVSARTK